MLNTQQKQQRILPLVKRQRGRTVVHTADSGINQLISAQKLRIFQLVSVHGTQCPLTATRNISPVKIDCQGM